ncbi:MAG: WecB/TagA/CpsF family glycosyltransferase [Pontiellaceae bacterium]|nr:WecB/TagA/CpsF family glycosyltransferase [Pontiellaceae bacterium]
MMESIQTRSLLGINVSIIDFPQLLNGIDRLAVAKRSALVNNVNVHACNLAFEQPEFRDVLNRTEIVFCDGFGVKIGAWLAGIRLGQRMTPPDWINDLFSLGEEKGYSFFFVGDELRVVNLFSETVAKKYPNLNIAGYHDGFFDFFSVENDAIIEQIHASNADIILTGMGMPRQELWAADAAKKLDKGVFIAAGALFRWYTGVDRRAPKWMTDHGLEWLARWVMHPIRHFKRYGVGIPLFFFRVIRCHWFRGDRKRD